MRSIINAIAAAAIAAITAVIAAVTAARVAAWAQGRRVGTKRARRQGAGRTTTRTPSSARPPDVVAIAVEPGAPALTSLKGLGAVSAERLGEIGVTTIAQIAAWSDDDVEAIAQQIKVSAERIRREDWVGQARGTAKA